MSTPLNPNVGIGPSSSNPYGIQAGNSNALKYGVDLSGGGLGSFLPDETAGDDSVVYMGKTRTQRRTRPTQDMDAFGNRVTAQPGGGAEVDDVMNLEDARTLPARWAREDPKKLREFVNKGIIAKIPGFDPDMGLPEIMDKWDDLLSVSSELYKRGQKWTPWDVMGTYGPTKGAFGTERKGDWVYDIATGKAVKYVGPTSKTQKRSNVNLTSAEDVRAIALQAMREALGRAPTDQEVAQFATTINAMERAAPEVTETTVQLRPNLETGEVEEVSSSSTTSGGVSQAAIAGTITGSVDESPEAAKYQGGTTYFNALLGLLGG